MVEIFFEMTAFEWMKPIGHTFCYRIRTIVIQIYIYRKHHKINPFGNKKPHNKTVVDIKVNGNFVLLLFGLSDSFADCEEEILWLDTAKLICTVYIYIFFLKDKLC